MRPLSEQHIYYYRFPGQPIGRHSSPFGYLTHACRVACTNSQGEELELIGLASSEESAKRTAKNLISRNEERTNGENHYGPVEVSTVGKSPVPGIKGVDRFIKLLWKPADMNKAWNKTLHFKGRYLVLGETPDCWFVLILKAEHKVSKTTGEIIYKDENGKRVSGGPIFVKDF